MLETIFGSILTAGLTGSAFVICLLVALALGALVAAVYMYKNTYTQSMASRWRCCPQWCRSSFCS